MRQSKLFTKTRKEAPAGEESKNAELLIRAGYVHKEMAGVYSYLPLGHKVMNNISNIIREEMDAIGGEEMLMTTLQDPEIWKKSNRWVEEDVDPTSGLPWFKTSLSAGGELGIANTHEEALVNILRQHVSSYKDLPIYAYQIQNKFRNELRAKSGLLRGREFLMKDMYSFSRSEEEFKIFYEKCADAYMKIFERVGLGDSTFRTFASGGAFSKYSDEFQTLSEVGEDTIYLDSKKKIAVNKEVYTDEVLEELDLQKENLEEVKAIEVGNIFTLGTKYAEALGLLFKNEEGKEAPVFMGSYGIGIGRLLATVVEKHGDENGLIWPENIAPFQVHLISIGSDDEVVSFADDIYEKLQNEGIEVLYDERNTSPGEKLADADLMGVPYRAVISNKTLVENKIEVKKRDGDEIDLLPYDEFLKQLQK